MSRFDVSDNADELNASIDTTNFPRSNSIVSNGSLTGSLHENGSFRFRNSLSGSSRKNSQDESNETEEQETEGGDAVASTQNGFMRRPHPAPLKMRSISESNGHNSLMTPRTATTPGNNNGLCVLSFLNVNTIRKIKTTKNLRMLYR